MREIEILQSLKDKLFASLSNLSESWMYAVSKIDKFVYHITLVISAAKTVLNAQTWKKGQN